MSHLAYDKLARETLLMLMDSGQLRAAAKDQLVAYETYHLPPKLRLELPDQDAFTQLINPRTTQEHSRQLAAAIMEVARTEESDTWIVAHDRLEVETQLAIGRSNPNATPLYGNEEAPTQEAQQERTETGEALARVVLDNGHKAVLRRGAGLVLVFQSRWSPRLSMMEAPEEGSEAGFLLADGPVEVFTSDGRQKSYEAPARIPITHDLTFKAEGPRWRPWKRPLEGRIEVLGVSRLSRPGLMLTDRTGETFAWERNGQPMLEVGPEGAVRSTEVNLTLHSGAGDRLDIEPQSQNVQWSTWFDGRPLRLPPNVRVPVLGSHLVGLGRDEDPIQTRLASASPSPPPRVVEIHGWRPPTSQDQKPFSGLFGFEQPVAVIWEDGQRLDPSAENAPVRVPVHDQALVGMMCAVALDGCPGCKLVPMTTALAAEGLSMRRETWGWFQGIVPFTMPGGRWRLEALDRVKIIYGEPYKVRSLSADPEDAWHIQGWTISVVGDELDISEPGRVPMILDRKPIDRAQRVPLEREHRLTIGTGIYRIVRRQSDQG